MILRFFLPLLLIGSHLQAKADESEPQFLLPKGVSAAWVLKPGQELPPQARFDVDGGGRAFLLMHPRILRLPSGDALPLKEDCSDLLLSGEDSLYLLSERAAGTAELKGPDEEKRTWARVKEKLLLPGPGWRLADGGAAHGVVAYGFDEESERYQAYRLGDRRKLLDSPERLQAVAELDGALAVAQGTKVLLLREGAQPEALQAPAGGATQLAALPGIGLAAAHPSGLFLLRSGKKPLPIAAAAYPKIRAKGGALYVMLREGGILKLSGLQALKDMP